MHQYGQIGDKLPIVVDHLQEGTQLPHIARYWGLLDGIHLCWCYTNAMVPKVIN